MRGISAPAMDFDESLAPQEKAATQTRGAILHLSDMSGASSICAEILKRNDPDDCDPPVTSLAVAEIPAIDFVELAWPHISRAQAAAKKESCKLFIADEQKDMLRAIAGKGALASLLQNSASLDFGAAWAPFGGRLPALKSLLCCLAAALPSASIVEWGFSIQNHEKSS